jgi:hypothetical protein
MDPMNILLLVIVVGVGTALFFYFRKPTYGSSSSTPNAQEHDATVPTDLLGGSPRRR